MTRPTSSICENLYAEGAAAVRAPLLRVESRRAGRARRGMSDRQLVRRQASPSTPANGGYPSEYRGALFFADYSRDCIWAMLPGSDGVPDPARIRTFAAGAANPVQLQIGPGGDLFYADFDGGTIRRVQLHRWLTSRPPPPPPPPRPPGPRRSPFSSTVRAQATPTRATR